MKIVEITEGLSIILNNEEAGLLEKYSFEEPVLKKSLSEREKIIANQLVIKDVLLRKNNNGSIQYSKKKARPLSS
jgi:hypothetical protein